MGNQQSNEFDEKNPQSLYDKELIATADYAHELNKNAMLSCHLSSSGEKNTPCDNSSIEYNYELLDLPKDEEGFCKAFALEEEQEILNFFKKYGVVVVKDILTEVECTNTEDEIWEFISRHTDNQVQRENPESWENWPPLKQLGILGNMFILSKQCFENRQNPKIAKIFKVILETNDVFVNVGRVSAMRPTKNVLINGKIEDKEEWKTLPNWLHWDMNPWTGLTSTFSFHSRDFYKNRGYDTTKLQGFISCVDCGPKDGGFHCVPGFQNHIRGWANENLKYFKENDFDVAGSIQVPKSDPIWNDIQTVPVRKGSLLIWSSCLPHGTFPNDSDHGRMIQYIKMARKDDFSVAPIFKNEKLLPEDFILTPQGRELLWIDEAKKVFESNED